MVETEQKEHTITKLTKFMEHPVLELAGAVMGPFAGMVLADLGCDVVRVDPPPANNGSQKKIWVDTLCRHKRSVVVDFKSPASRAAFLELLEVADILIDPYRPGAFDRMIGMAADELCQRYPRLIYARLTGFSRYDKRYSHVPGHENNFMAVSGALPALQNVLQRGEKNGTVSRMTVNYLADCGGGSMGCVTGILAAVIHRTASGKGQIVDASVQQGTSYLATFPLQRRNGQPAGEPEIPVNDAPWSDVYRTSDGKYMMVCSIEDVFYDRMIRGLGLDPTVIPDRADRRNWSKLGDILAKRFASRTQNYWRGVFDDLQACVSPVVDADDPSVDIDQPLVNLSRTPSLPGELSSRHSPKLSSGQGDEEVLQRWLGAKGNLIAIHDTASRILTRVKPVDRQSSSKW